MMTVKRVVAATDFSADAEAALDCARGIARRFDAHLHVVHVVENPMAAGAWSSELYTAEIAGLQINLVRDAEERLRRELAPAGDPQVTWEVRTGGIADQIIAAGEERSADLIVLGTRGRTGLAHLMMGSVAERVVRLAPCPVLTVRARLARRQQRSA